MAVVQISKIQVRRGLADALPQLASGEMGWAIDDQALYIGNGSVSEGAPYVGNTKVLTEHDNILDLALQYQYKRNDSTITTGTSPTAPIQRTLQERLDDVISVRSFGAIGDGATDDTLAIQRAIDQLYLNTDKGSVDTRIVLNFEAGTYYVSSAIRVPPYATLRGAGKDKTIIQQYGSFPVFVTVNDSSTPGNYADISTTTFQNQPRNIEVSDMTLENTISNYAGLELVAARSSMFKNIKLVGQWELGDAIQPLGAGINLIAKSYQITTGNNVFDQCEVVNFSNAILGSYDIESNNFENCIISECGYGVVLGGRYNTTSDEIESTINGITTGVLYGPSRNKFTNSKFIDVDRSGVYIITGRNNISENNTYIRVGNDGGTSETAVYPVVHFEEVSNVSVNDYFERSVDLTSAPGALSLKFVPEISGAVNANHRFNNEIELLGGQTNVPLLRLSATQSVSYKIHYFYKSILNDVIRQGTMFVTVDKATDKVHFTDDSSSIGTSPATSALTFSATLEDADLNAVKDTLFIRYTNTVANDAGSYVNYWYETLS